ncbi:MAG: thiopeptide-type bacteriocin biosynthesis protein [Pseudonocardiaceae bacterium]
MNHGTDPQPASPSWRQVFIQFDDYSTAEHIGVAHLGPDMTSAEAAGLIASWFFIRKAPCWRLRFRPSHDRTEQDATTFIHQQLTTHQEAGRIASWVETIYEPEMHAFGGPVAMNLAHHLFHSDSRHILAYLTSFRATTSGGCSDQRRELSILLCSTLMRGAGQDWYEQGDIWARVAEHRSLPPDTPPDRLRTMEPDLRRLMTVDASLLMRENGPLTVLSTWSANFEEAGRALADLARNGTLRRGVRAVLAHHVIFHWNRIGLPYTTQSILATGATAVVLGR